MRAIHTDSRGTYGAPRVHAELAEAGVAVGRKRVARVMRAASIAGVSRRRGPRTTRRDVQARPAPDRVERHFAADAPNRLWVADITYVPTLVGFLYLAIVLDVFSRRVVGWAMATHLRTELVVEALEMAVEQRRPEAVVHHSDQGCQYTSLAFGGRCREWGVALSMGSVGDCFDNAMAESFFATLECELLARTTLATHAEARAAIFEFIEGWYNTRRRHSALSSPGRRPTPARRARRQQRLLQRRQYVSSWQTSFDILVQILENYQTKLGSAMRIRFDVLPRTNDRPGLQAAPPPHRSFPPGGAGPTHR